MVMRVGCQEKRSLPGTAVYTLYLVFTMVFGIWCLPSNRSDQGSLGGTPFWHSQISPDEGWIMFVITIVKITGAKPPTQME